MSDPNFPPDKRNVSVDLWGQVRDLICILFSLCGDPADLAQQHTLTFRNYKILLPWIRAGEALLRRFLIMEAALLPEAEPKHGPPAPSPARLSNSRTRHTELDSNPDKWRVSFRFAAPARVTLDKLRLTPSNSAIANTSLMLSLSEQARPKHPSRFRSAIPLARRIEAILRVYNNPLPYAQRLAARLRNSTAMLARLAKDGWESFRFNVGDRLYDAILPLIDEALQKLRGPTSATNTS